VKRDKVGTLGIRKGNEQEANSDEHRETAEDVHIVLDTSSSEIVPKHGAAPSPIVAEIRSL
jgi:hypothetical protein